MRFKTIFYVLIEFLFVFIQSGKTVMADFKIESQNVISSSERPRKVQTKRPPPTKVVCVKKKALNQQGYKDLVEWLQDANHVYIGRDMTHYVPGAVGSKWQNPFKVDKHGRDRCTEMYREYLFNDQTKHDGQTLLESIEELRGKTLGCWCKPDMCHGDVLVQTLMRKKPQES